MGQASSSPKGPLAASGSSKQRVGRRRKDGEGWSFRWCLETEREGNGRRKQGEEDDNEVGRKGRALIIAFCFFEHTLIWQSLRASSLTGHCSGCSSEGC